MSLAISTSIDPPVLVELQYEDPSVTPPALVIYGMRARIEVTPGPAEEIYYISLYRQLMKDQGGVLVPVDPNGKEYVDDFYWMYSHETANIDYYEAYDYSYFDPTTHPPAIKWHYTAEALVYKTYYKTSNPRVYP